MLLRVAASHVLMTNKWSVRVQLANGKNDDITHVHLSIWRIYCLNYFLCLLTLTWFLCHTDLFFTHTTHHHSNIMKNRSQSQRKRLSSSRGLENLSPPKLRNGNMVTLKITVSRKFWNQQRHVLSFALSNILRIAWQKVREDRWVRGCFHVTEMSFVRDNDKSKTKKRRGRLKNHQHEDECFSRMKMPNMLGAEDHGRNEK